MLKSNLAAPPKQELKKLQLLLADPNESQYLDFSRKLSPDGQLVKKENELAIEMVKEKYGEQYNPTYSSAEIRAEMLKYNLAFMKAEYFKGEYSMDFLKKLKLFIEEKKLSVSDYDLKKQIYVLAPDTFEDSEHFNVDENCKDPLLFFNVEKGYYTLLDGDKNYINPYQRYLGIKRRTSSTNMLLNIVENILAIPTLMFLVGLIIHIPFIPFIITAVVLVIVFSFLRGILSPESSYAYHEKKIKNSNI